VFRIIDQKNFCAGILYSIIGLAVAFGGASYPIGSTARMGPGYFPTLLGVALTVIGGVVLLGAITAAATPSRLESINWRPLIFIALAVLAFALLLKPMGMAAAIFALVIVSSFAKPKRSWRRVLLTATALVPLVYLVFVVLTGLRLNFLPAFIGG
jgi:hypothetical protein